MENERERERRVTVEMQLFSGVCLIKLQYVSESPAGLVEEQISGRHSFSEYLIHCE
jgi:hypothetical protein